MKVGILTFHNAHNYGAVLQAYALRTKLRKMGHDAHIINYCNKKIQNRYSDKLKLEVSKRDIVFPTHWIKIIGKKLQNDYAQDTWKKQCNSFNKFISGVLLENSTTKVTIDDLNKMKVDAFICGSDQVWASWITDGLDPVYFLDFQTSAKKISYAASMPSNKIPTNEQSYFKKCINLLDFVSVREEQVSIALNNLCDRSIKTVVDPTVLLNADDYSELSSASYEKEDYVFVYFIHEDNVLMKCAQKIALQLGKKLIELHYYLRKDLKGHDQRADFGPSQFLTYIENADFVLTNSFHGTVFSIIYGKKFYSVYNKDDRKDNLLNNLKLQSRHIYSINNINLNQDIDYQSVYELLYLYRQSSIDFLSKALS
ncbi:polysaccharide pyruvyl transferase family protein [Clostridium tyrobutyricum]|uniref:polysaccharide pyruvyl transferase family protein n=1 Tax=Clostridium tyrobutyricum TaxID=1519 RepID=UPI0002EFE7B9|nr:polysaccharide pyruvyl transferase family protein [Clostridium tyrobutyricum]MEA5007119.1 polysaccharide pyruvyl transferase family protein [Clostridium tyrobutyricum]